jgi:hypothetical protein
VGVERYEIWIDGANVDNVDNATTEFQVTLAEGEHTWMIKAVDYAGNENSSAEWRITIDLTAPTAPLAVSPADGALLASQQVTLSWSASEENNFKWYELWLDGSLALTENDIAVTSATLTLPDGVHTWRVVAVDLAGNENASALRSFEIDSTPPSGLALVSPAENAVIENSTVTFHWSEAADVNFDRYELFLDGSLVARIGDQSTTSATVLGLDEGSHSWYVIAYDLAGNSTKSDARTFTIDLPEPPDRTPPSGLALVSPADGAILRSNRVEFSWTAVVEENFDRYELWLDGALVKIARSVLETSAALLVSEGTHRWYVIAYDLAGNSTKSQTWRFTVTLLERSVEVQLAENFKTVSPGEETAYTVIVTNTGAVADNFQVLVETADGWEVRVEPEIVSLRPGESATVTVRLKAPADIAPGTLATVTVEVRSLSMSGISDTTGASVSVKKPERVGLPLSWMLIALAPLVGAAAWVMSRRGYRPPRRRIRRKAVKRRAPKMARALRRRPRRVRRPRARRPARRIRARPVPRRAAARRRRPAVKKRPKWEEEPEFLEHLKKQVTRTGE